MAHVQLSSANEAIGENFMSGNTCAPQCANARDSIMYWFIDDEYGMPTKEDVHPVYKNAVPTRTTRTPHYTHHEYDPDDVQPSFYKYIPEKR
jgi:hypothetical protein